MGGDPVVIIPSTHMINMGDPTYADDVSDLESFGDDHIAQPQQANNSSSNDDDDESSEDEEEDVFPDFPPNFDFQSKSIPPHFLCPLTRSIMCHPVIDAEGNTYERRAILRWLDLEDVSPITGNPLSPVDLVENKRRMAAIEKYREEVWTAYNGDEKDEALYKQTSYKEKQRMMRKERQKYKKKGSSSSKRKEHDLLTDKSAKLLMQMQEELDALQGQTREEVEAPVDSHVEYLLHKKREEQQQQQPPNSIVMERIRSKRREGYVEGANTSMVRKQSSRSPNKETRKMDPPSRQPSRDGLNTSLVVRKPSSRSPHHDPLKSSMTRKSPTSDLDLSDRSERSSNRQSSRPDIDSSDKSNGHRNSLEGSYSSLGQPAMNPNVPSRSPHCESKSPMISPDVRQSMNSLALVQNLPCPPIASAGSERKSSRRLMRDPAVSSSLKSLPSQGMKVSPAPPPQRSSNSSSNALATRSSSYRSSPNIHDRTSKELIQCSITDRIIAEVNGQPEPALLVKMPYSKANPTTASTASESHHSNNNVKLDHGWSVPIGVHKVICDAPGLLVTCDVHRRSAPVKRINDGAPSESNARSRRKQSFPDQYLVVPAGAYIEVMETQVHGDRVRGRIQWEETVSVQIDEAHKMTRKMSIKNFSSKLSHKKNKVATNEPATLTVTHKYNGWVSLRWAGERDETMNSRGCKATDEDAGPWTEPVSIGVYTITFGHGLPLRSSPDRNSELVGMLQKGQFVEVVETQITGDRVRARCIAASSTRGERSLSGWISLFNAVTGSSGATPVPCGAYVTVTKSGCTVTEGGSLNSKFRSLLKRGSCVDIVSTRIEDGAVRGLISSGGYVTLIGPKRNHVKKNGKSSSPKDEQYLMHVPIGVFKVVYPDGLPVLMGVQSNAPSAMDLELDSFVQVIETRVNDGRVCGRIIAVINDNIRHEIHGWIYLFESKKRWCKFSSS
ncbi:hypothetical protein ACHAWO_003608 [Cyclotella atomus]|uniref:U-box domain-containing protein n=1 Tax=Cyclotella atomus TaxID=382360 RepID=A0ABD3P224_9STRA